LVALRCAVRRISDDFMVRHDQKQCDVTLTMADGTIVGFRRRKTPSFRLNGEEGMGFSSENAAKLAEAAKLPEVTHPDGSAGQDVHFATQKSPMFLVNESKGTVAKFFGSSSDAGKLMQMRNVLRERERVDKARAAQLEGATVRRAAELAALAEIDGVEAGIAAAERERVAIVELEAAAAALALLLAELERLEVAARRLAERAALLALLRDPPRLDDDAPLLAAAGGIERASAEESRWSRRVEALAPLRAPPGELPARELGELLATLVAGNSEAGRLRAVAERLHTLTAPPEAQPVAELERVVGAIDREAAACAVLTARGRVFEALTPVPVAESIEGLVGIGTELRSAGDELERKRIAVREAVAAYEACDSKLAEAKRVLGECPTCGKSLVDAHDHGGVA
ncbi:MAG: hypothetical protein ACOYN0_13870, partial [Phycisphaerales bacterium]